MKYNRIIIICFVCLFISCYSFVHAEMIIIDSDTWGIECETYNYQIEDNGTWGIECETYNYQIEDNGTWGIESVITTDEPSSNTTGYIINMGNIGVIEVCNNDRMVMT